MYVVSLILDDREIPLASFDDREEADDFLDQFDDGVNVMYSWYSGVDA